MNKLFWGILLTLPALANVGSNTPTNIETPEMEEVEPANVQMNDKKIQDSEIDKHKELEKQMQEDLELSEQDELKTEKDY